MRQGHINGLQINWRLVMRFNEKYAPVPEAGCWIWIGAAGRYGGMSMNGKHIDAHRASWLLFKGEIPEGLRVCHKCDTPLCVNPDHLFLATAKENTHDMMKKGRHKFGTWGAPKGDNHWTRKRKNERV